MTDRYQSHRNAPQKPAQKPVKSLFDEAAGLVSDILTPFKWAAWGVVFVGGCIAAPLLDRWNEKSADEALEKHYEKLEGEMK